MLICCSVNISDYCNCWKVMLLRSFVETMIIYNSKLPLFPFWNTFVFFKDTFNWTKVAVKVFKMSQRCCNKCFESLRNKCCHFALFGIYRRMLNSKMYPFSQKNRKQEWNIFNIGNNYNRCHLRDHAKLKTSEMVAENSRLALKTALFEAVMISFV